MIIGQVQDVSDDSSDEDEVTNHFHLSQEILNNLLGEGRERSEPVPLPNAVPAIDLNANMISDDELVNFQSAAVNKALIAYSA